MATFAKATFNAGTYAAFRPTYPRTLYDRILAFHRGQRRRVLDVGCGTGQVALEPALGEAFEAVVAVDPSPQMVAAARAAAERLPPGVNRPTFEQASAENLTCVGDASVDLAVAGQAAHWFDYSRIWAELDRVLAPGGTFAFWGYSEARFTHWPELTPLVTRYAQGRPDIPEDAPPTFTQAEVDADLDTVGPFWQQPGRWILETHLRHIGTPEPYFQDITRVYHTGAHYPAYGTAQPVLLKKSMPWPALEAYLRTWSALHTYHERRPEDKERVKEQDGLGSPDGDVVQRFLWRVHSAIGAAAGAEVELEWPLVLVMGRKSAS